MDRRTAAASCACFNLRRTARAVTQLYDAALAPSGLRVTQFTVLLAVSLADGVPLSRLAEALVMDRTTLTRNLRPLEARGWIRVERGADDRRERLARLTREGDAALEAALPLWRDVQDRLVGRIGRDRWPMILGELGAVVAAATAEAP